MGVVCDCDKKREAKYQTEVVEKLQLNENREISKKITTSTSKLNISGASFIRQKHFKEFYEEYEEITQVGKGKLNMRKGAFGVVKKVRHLKTQQLRAMKMVQKTLIKDDKAYIDEIEILKKLDHPNILKLYECYYDEKNYYVITEFCNGGELFDKIQEFGFFDEKIAAQIMNQVFMAVNYCHSMGIVHRDLKPENILIETSPESTSNDFFIKLIDFGTSKPFKPNQTLKEKTGTPYYVAPEVLHNNYNELCDMWSCGVILFILLTGIPPFNGENDVDIIRKVEEGKVDYSIEEFQHVSKEATSLLKKLLNYDPKQRINATTALDDPWIKKYRNKSTNVNKGKAIKVLEKLQNFKAEDTLAKASLAYLVNQILSKEETVELRNIFQSLDNNNDGLLSYSEIIEGFKKYKGHYNSDYELKKIFQMVDQDQNGFISYEEFLRATIDLKDILSEKNLEEAFKQFDKNGDGSISALEIKEVLGKGLNISDNVWEDIVKQVDINNDGEVSLEEFKKMMRKLIT